MKKCPPGVICIENVTLFSIGIIVVVIGYVVYLMTHDSSLKKQYHHSMSRPFVNRELPVIQPMPMPRELPQDVLLDPYAPPLKDERYLLPRVVPINISTNPGFIDTQYRQVGILTPTRGSTEKKILPLMGRPLYTSRQKWQYYTISNQNNQVKLPVKIKGKSGTSEYGVDELYGGDNVFVEGYNIPFRFTTYDNNDAIQYIPVL